MTPEQKRLDREIICLRWQLKAVAGRKFPWCGAPGDTALAEECRREAISLAMRLRAKYHERVKLQTGGEPC